MPRYLDDLWYDVNLKVLHQNSDLLNTWTRLFQTWQYHLTIDNARLSNIVFVPFLIIPKWVGSLLSAILWGIACAWSARLVGVNPLKSPTLSIGMFMWAFFMPWYDGMGIENYQFNYIFATFLSILFLLLYLHNKTNASGWKGVGLFLTGFLIGIWHEGFTAPILASLIWLFFRHKQWHNKRKICLAAGLALGMVWFLSWPVSWSRIGMVYGESEKFGVGRILFILFQHLNFLIMCGVLLICLCRNKWRKELSDTILIALLINVACSLAIHYLTTRTSRTGWWGEFCSVLVIMRLIYLLFPKFNKKYNRRTIWICIPLILLTYIHQIAVDCKAIHIGKIFNNAIETHLRSGQNEVFTKIDDEYTSPLICMYAPDFTSLISPVGLYFINLRFHSNDDGYFIAIPYELEYITEKSGTEIPPVDKEADTEIRIYKDRLFMPAAEESQYEFKADIDYGYTIKHNVRIIAYPFTSKADGKRYAFIYPWRQVVQMRIGNIKAITPHKLALPHPQNHAYHRCREAIQC
ncbi:MAG: DUF6056 family protein [Ruminococcus sp.]|nr:DUF6056 family protein [Ruminococcus sp.]